MKKFKEYFDNKLNEEKVFSISKIKDGVIKEVISGTIDEIRERFSAAIDDVAERYPKYKNEPTNLEELLDVLNAAQQIIEKTPKPKIVFKELK